MDPADSLSSSTDFPVFPVIRFPCSADFSDGTSGFLQLLNMPLSPCCPYHPAEVVSPPQSVAALHAAFAPKGRARPSDLCVSRPPVGLLSLRPGDLLTIHMMALSVGYTRFVSSTSATLATGLLTFTPVGLLSY